MTNACENCGINDGYYFFRDERFTVLVTPGGEQNADFIKVVRVSKPRCNACNKVVQIDEEF